MKNLIDAARAKSLTIATAESCTGGMVAVAITDTAGSSAVFDRGFITYSNAAKMQMLGVQSNTLDAFGAVSEQVAREMALGALAQSGAQVSVSVTGIAGPGGSEHKPEGRVCFGIAINGRCTTETIDFGPLGRSNVRVAARDHALALLVRAVDSFSPTN